MKLTFVASICSLPHASAVSLSSDIHAIVPEGSWDGPKITKLMQSTTNLIRDSMSSQVTPAIARFSEKTIEKIDDEVLPALKAAHDLDVQLLADELHKFELLRQEIESKKVEVQQRDVTCSTTSEVHVECRTSESTIASQREECETQSTVTQSEVTACEDYVSTWESKIDELWCEQDLSHDRVLSDDFFTDSKDAMTSYASRTLKCTTTWEEHRAHHEKCEKIVTQVTEKRTECDSSQEHLEECTCDRANLVDEYTDKYTREWTNMTSVYTSIVNHLLEEVHDRKQEHQGLQVVKCLLVQVKALGIQDGPCNESHVQEVEAEIKACHDEHHDSTHFDIDPEPAPDLETPIYDPAPYPCNADFIAMYYSHLPANAAHKECSNAHCVPKLREHIVMGRPYTTDNGNLLAEVQFTQLARSVWAGPTMQHRETPDGWTRESARLATEHWVRSGQHEHASVASFSRASLDILKFAGPPGLVSATHQAAMEEVEHAQSAFSLAEVFNLDNEKHVEVGQFPFDQVTLASSLVELSGQVFAEGCMGETEAVTKMSFALAHLLPNSPAATVLPTLIEQEAKHAALAWKTLQWSLSSSPSPKLQIKPLSGLADRPHESPLLLSWAGIVPPSIEGVLSEKVRTGVVEPWLQALQGGAVKLPAVHLGVADATSRAVQQAATIIRDAFNLPEVDDGFARI